MKKLLILLFSAFILCSSSVFAKSMNTLDFVYTSAYECGDEKYDWFETLHYKMKYIYTIYFDDNENVVISNSSVLYKSFEETFVPQLYWQNGGVYSLSFKKNDGTYIFLLKRDPRKLKKKDTLNFANADNYRVESLIFDKSNLTYIIRYLQKNSQNEVVKSSEGTTGICFKVI